MQGIVKLKNAAPTKGDALFCVIHRAELRAVVLSGNEVAWSTLSGDYEAEFFDRQAASPQLAMLFFHDLVEGTDALVTWENDSDDEQWLRNKAAVRL